MLKYVPLPHFFVIMALYFSMLLVAGWYKQGEALIRFYKRGQRVVLLVFVVKLLFAVLKLDVLCVPAQDVTNA